MGIEVKSSKPTIKSTQLNSSSSKTQLSKTLKLVLNNKEYELNIDKVLYVLKRLYNDETLRYENDKQLIKLMDNLKLIDEIFLDSVDYIELEWKKS